VVFDLSMLIDADKLLAENGVIFAYSVHGGTFQGNTLSFGKFGIYLKQAMNTVSLV